MSKANTTNVLAGSLAIGLFAHHAHAHGAHGDMLIYTDSGKLVTGYYDFDGGTGIVTGPGPTHVYLTELEADWESGGTPGVDEPGIATDGSHPNDPDGTLYPFPASTALTVTANLLPTLNMDLASGTVIMW